MSMLWSHLRLNRINEVSPRTVSPPRHPPQMALPGRSLISVDE
jgi:hypothetical protein